MIVIGLETFRLGERVLIDTSPHNAYAVLPHVDVNSGPREFVLFFLEEHCYWVYHNRIRDASDGEVKVEER